MFKNKNLIIAQQAEKDFIPQNNLEQLIEKKRMHPGSMEVKLFLGMLKNHEEFTKVFN